MTPTTVVLGAMLGLGLALLLAFWSARIPRIADRIAPHVRASAAEELRRLNTPTTPFPTIERLLAPVVRDGVRWVERWGSPTQDLRARLVRAGFRADGRAVSCATSGVGRRGPCRRHGHRVGACRFETPVALRTVPVGRRRWRQRRGREGLRTWPRGLQTRSPHRGGTTYGRGTARPFGQCRRGGARRIGTGRPHHKRRDGGGTSIHARAARAGAPLSQSPDATWPTVPESLLSGASPTVWRRRWIVGPLSPRYCGPKLRTCATRASAR